ncbi:response regulator [Alkalinema sp. FACHB-956]|uniref:hybrid sensor histidine kinase/response regulator n=1 Tax=Alkalinema sp. FACHB-956 TaxID=2692768 RepID=UPI001689AF60|nr:response regulator [Alkalinema sp. FACHB-956]MBD2325859.1 response regulator [Alkalinema sp. FACHB-956]
MSSHLRVLVVEDSEDDTVLLLRELRRGGYRVDSVRVETAEEMQTILDLQPWDLVIADYTLPQFSAPDALKLLQQRQQDLPFIIVSGTIGEETAVAAMKAGAHDYITKGNLARLIPAVERELREAVERQKRHSAEQALRESEERFRQLAENIVESVFWMADPVGQQFLYVSPNYRRIWGKPCQPDGGVDFLDWLAAIHPEDRYRIQTQFFTRSLAGTYDEEYRILHPDGTIHWIRDRGFPINNAHGEAYRLVGIAEDITDRKLAEEALRRSQRLESLGTLASGIAHDFNNILTPILAIAQLLHLKFPNLDERTQQLLDIVEDSARRGADLVRQVLAFARGEEGVRVPLQLRHLLTEISRVIRQTFPKNLELQIELLADHLWLVSADVTQIHQVLMNLCVNARDSMPQGGRLTLVVDNVEIDEAFVRSNLEAHPGAYVMIQIIDTGVGIPPELLERIFDPFFTTKEVGKGTGLGLSIVLGIVKSHGGFIQVQSQVGQGSQFSVYLPAIKETVTLGSTTPQEWATLEGNGKLILVVEDEPLIRQVTKTTLEDSHYRTLIAQDGMEAIALYEKHQQEIQLVLMDIMMPVMDGLTAIRMLHAINPNVNVIAMSGLVPDSQIAELNQLGVKAFLSKPYTAQELLKTIQKCIAS